MRLSLTFFLVSFLFLFSNKYSLAQEENLPVKEQGALPASVSSAEPEQSVEEAQSKKSFVCEPGEGIVSLEQTPKEEILASEGKTRTVLQEWKQQANFHRKLEVTNKYQALDNSTYVNETDFKLTLPTLRNSGAVRITVPYVTTDQGQGTQGLGDVELRFNNVFFAKGKWGLAAALEATFDTAQGNNLGSGYNTLAPILATSYSLSEQWRLEPNIKFKAALGSGYKKYHQSTIDLNLNWKGVNSQYWAQIDPKIEIDHVKEKTSASVELEVGTQLGEGIGVYVRPSFPLGKFSSVQYGAIEQKFDWAIECGVKYVY